ncbi:ribonuclease T2 family protein [Shewanella acanthi]|uniref:ribonuclease T2 family protein n=1 Tax=Shewanella acanthi TaxID=2864212 RepID=UPI001C657B14|nr:ribonuclease T [Shewanella acanthi]QYJ78692.1 ribonuclease T [Shewanella acanthi]
MPRFRHFSHSLQSLLLVFTLAVIYLPFAYSADYGEFITDKTCELFQSKNKRTNPDASQTRAGEHFKVVELLGNSANPDWLRVQTSSSKSPLRWVKGDCGRYQTAVSGSKKTPPQPTVASSSTSFNKQLDTQSQGNLCQISGKFDSNVLALSWQSTFCELYGQDKAECNALSQSKNDAKWQYFSLHGLWPNRQQCGVRYSYCSKVKQQPRDFCDYPDVTLSGSVKKSLDKVMPSALHGSCLERHEWWKHGSCRDESPDEYFALSAQLTQEVNASTWVQSFIHDNIGNKVSRTELLKSFEISFGEGSQSKLSLVCAKGLLSEIRLSLPQTIESQDSLPSLLAKAPKAKKGNCPETIAIDQPN